MVIDTLHMLIGEPGYIDTAWGTVMAKAVDSGIEIAVYRLSVSENPVVSMMVDSESLRVDDE